MSGKGPGDGVYPIIYLFFYRALVTGSNKHCYLIIANVLDN